MPQSRGMIKIVPKSDDDLTILDAIENAIDWAVDYLPYFIDFYNTVSDSTNEYTDREIIDTYQSFWYDVWEAGYMFYVEDFQLTFHGKNTETYRTGNGTSSGIQTNKESYREFAFKTTISERDWDVVKGYWSNTMQAVRKKDFLGLPSAEFKDWGDSVIGYNIIWQYLKKRQAFLRDLENVDITISSSMFESADVKMTEYSYVVPVGQQETIYSLKFKEVVDLEDTDYTTGQDAIEAGS